MPTTLIPMLAIEAVLATMVIVLFVWRQSVARKEDDTLHVLHGTISEQTTVASKLEKLDKWGKLATLVAVIFGVIVGAFYVYTYWMTSSHTTGV